MQTLFESGGVARTLPLAVEPTSAVSSKTGVRALLKRSTHALHLAVERSFDLQARSQDVDSYRRLLARFLGFYLPLEQRLSRVGGYASVGMALEPRLKLPLLQQDLGTLGMDAGTRAHLPICGELPAIEDMADALGCLYVLEGSTLGGRVITRVLASRLGLTPEKGSAFFASYGERLEPMWAQFCVVLEAFAASHPARQDSMSRSAQATFRSLGDWLASSPA